MSNDAIKAMDTVCITFGVFKFYLLNRRQDPECPCDREKLDKDKVHVLNECAFPSAILNLPLYF